MFFQQRQALAVTTQSKFTTHSILQVTVQYLDHSCFLDRVSGVFKFMLYIFIKFFT